MKIGIDIRAIDKNNLRGIGKYTYFLLKYLMKIDRENNYLLFCDKRSPFRRDIEFASNFRRVPIGIKGDKFCLWEQFRLPLKLLFESIDFMHWPSNTGAILNSVPSVITLHDAMMFDTKSLKMGEKFYYNFILKKTLEKSKAIITCSYFSKKQIVEALKIPSDKVFVVYHGIDPIYRQISDKKIISDTLQRYGINSKFIFCIGGDTKRKNIPMLIRAYIDLKNNHKIVHKLVIAGVESKKAIYEIIPPQFKSDIYLTPYLSEEDIVMLYNGADIFIYPTCNEGFGFPAIEAMACGTPIIISKVSSLPEVAGDAAVYIDPFDVYQMSQKILEVMQNDYLKRQLRESGLNHVKKFTWEDTARKTLMVYEQVYNNKSNNLRN